MPGGVLELIGMLALLAALCELVAAIFPRRLIDEMQSIVGEASSLGRRPVDEPEVRQLRDRGAL